MMFKTDGYLVTWAIVAITTIITSVSANEQAVSDNWFSIASVVRHEEALNGAHDVELSGNLAFIPGKGGSIAVVDVTDPEKPAILWFKRDTNELSDSETVLPAAII